MRVKPVDNPPNPWHTSHVEWLGEPPTAEMKVFEQEARSILSENQSPDIPFKYGLNPYRGCQHACAYCYARPSHQYLDFGAGTDFERKIIVKTNAPALLEDRFMRPSWKGETICISGNTDCYQPLEATYELTRACLAVCERFRNPVVIITKGTLIRRDLDLLSSLAENSMLKVWLSIGFVDEDHRRALEPGTPSIKARFKTLEILAREGIEVGVSVSPLIPGLNDSQLAEVLERAADLGASGAFMTLLRLPAEVAPVFEARLRKELPQRADRVLNGFAELREGQNRSEFGTRMVGRGPRWEMISRLFEAECKRLGLGNRQSTRADETTFRRPGEQISLF